MNIPEFKLRALNSSYRTELEMKVVVGKAFQHQIPVFAADMKYVIFRPYWNVPRSIQRAELVPKLNRDPSYLANKVYGCDYWWDNRKQRDRRHAQFE